ncbi:MULTISPECIES: hypothetical protein [Microbacterium]|jgi:succinate dehydrogenase hydrophobic anchor subunit|uniref:hypothetical protein n=1 Tax=Microbacterium TaxID=33882 RepID=UPI000D85F2D1|nr:MULTISPECIES: hypothetical protein [Microbacterium]MCT2225764.1 hypothetical protein [Microbacterium paraoxydans]NYF29370.1 succinate dehydrogenase hydrophobic anchor subunit [Microbacterium sp. JAI119]RBO73969.1 hypothetical protein DSP71_02415 [Microbacterium sp. H6]
MTGRNTLVRSLHDVGLAAWFGGTLMGAVGLNGGTAKATDPAERLRLSSIGWAKWAPVQLAAIIAHGIGGAGLILGNKSRLAAQPGSRTNTKVKFALTAAAAAATLYAGILGTKIAKHADEGGEGVTEADEVASPELTSAQRQQRVVQWVLPALTGVLIVLGAQQGEQQRPVAGLLHRLTHRS